MAQLEAGNATALRQGSAAMAGMARLGANRSTTERPTRGREGRDAEHPPGRDRRETPRDASATNAPAASPAARRLPTGLY